MKKVVKPVITSEKIFLECISNYRSTDLKRRLNNCIDTLKSETKLYNDKGIAKKLHEIPVNTNVDKVSVDEFKDIYTNKLAKAGQPGRWYYDEIIMSSTNEICPLCNQRKVSTVDHVLPKNSYPIFSVAPINLIPACGECNKTKNEHVPTCASEVHIHPYYDDIEDKQWLYAEVMETNPPSLKFYVKSNDELDNILNERILNHFTLFKIADLYATHSAAELCNLSYLYELFISGGASAVKSTLEMNTLSRKRNDINSWQAVMYESLASSDWFCSAGVLFYARIVNPQQ